MLGTLGQLGLGLLHLQNGALHPLGLTVWFSDVICTGGGCSTVPSLLDQLTIHSFIHKCYQGTRLHLGDLPMKETGSLSPLSLLGQAVAGMHSDYTDKDVI